MSNGDRPSKSEIYWAGWMEIFGVAALIGKKILCCPPSQRLELVGKALEAIEDE